MKAVVLVVLACIVAWLAYSAIRFFIRLKLPPRIPPELAFEHEIRSERTLREVAELLAKRFGKPTRDVVCLGVVRGNAARVLFHSGPQNRGKNVNIHRRDYILEVVRQGQSTMLLRLTLNRPYSYVRVRRAEVEPLARVLREVYGGLVDV